MHGDDIFRCPAPVSPHGEIAEREHLLLAGGDATGSGHNFLRDKSLWPQRAFVVEENAGGRVDAVGIAVLRDLPVGRCLGDAIRTAWPQHRSLVCRLSPDGSKHLRAACVVEPDRLAKHPDRLEQIDCANNDAFECFHRLLKRNDDGRLAC